MRPPNPKALQRRCDRFNELHPVGAAVRYHPVIGEKKHRETKTRSAARVLSGHSPVVWVEGEAGCVHLDAITVEKVREAGS